LPVPWDFFLWDNTSKLSVAARSLPGAFTRLQGLWSQYIKHIYKYVNRPATTN
jgi:hypothetical protein